MLRAHYPDHTCVAKENPCLFPGASGEARVLSELQTLLKTAEAMAAELEKALDDLVQYCDKSVSLQSMALHLSAHLKSKF